MVSSWLGLFSPFEPLKSLGLESIPEQPFRKCPIGGTVTSLGWQVQVVAAEVPHPMNTGRANMGKFEFGNLTLENAPRERRAGHRGTRIRSRKPDEPTPRDSLCESVRPREEASVIQILQQEYRHTLGEAGSPAPSRSVAWFDSTRPRYNPPGTPHLHDALSLHVSRPPHNVLVGPLTNNPPRKER